MPEIKIALMSPAAFAQFPHRLEELLPMATKLYSSKPEDGDTGLLVAS